MNRKIMLTLLLASITNIAHADNQALRHCMAAIQKKIPYPLIRLDSLDVTAKRIEIELKDSNGSEWEFVCHPQTGNIMKMEREDSSFSQDGFQGKLISLDKAKRQALNAQAGTITDIDFELEDDTRPVYAFKIISPKNQRMEVLIDALSGAVIKKERN